MTAEQWEGRSSLSFSLWPNSAPLLLGLVVGIVGQSGVFPLLGMLLLQQEPSSCRGRSGLARCLVANTPPLQMNEEIKKKRKKKENGTDSLAGRNPPSPASPCPYLPPSPLLQPHNGVVDAYHGFGAFSWHPRLPGSSFLTLCCRLPSSSGSVPGPWILLRLRICTNPLHLLRW